MIFMNKKEDGGGKNWLIDNQFQSAATNNIP